MTLTSPKGTTFRTDPFQNWETLVQSTTILNPPPSVRYEGQFKYDLKVGVNRVGLPDIYIGDTRVTGAIPTYNGFKKKVKPFNKFDLIEKVRLLEPQYYRDHFKGSNTDWETFMKGLIPIFGPKLQHRIEQMKWQHIWFSLPEELRKAAWSGRRINYRSVAGIYKNIDKVDQLAKDGLLRLAPLVIHSGLDPQELRASMGKGAWKRLLSQSDYRIRLIARNLDGPRSINGDFVRAICDIQSGILKNNYCIFNTELIAARLAPRVVDYRDVLNLVRDTDRMVQDFNPNWSLKRIKEEHERATERMNARRLEQQLKKDKEYQTEFAEAAVYEIDGYKYTRLNTKRKIQDEGAFMGHCVGGYASQAFNRSYEVFTVEKGTERATLGLFIQKGFDKDDKEKPFYSFNQSYGKRNSPISDELALANRALIIKLNEGVRSVVQERAKGPFQAVAAPRAEPIWQGHNVEQVWYNEVEGF